MIISKISLEEKPTRSYSVSRLKTYQECSYKYYNQYIQKIKVNSFSESTLMGSIIHSALEYLYSDSCPDDVDYLIDALDRTSSSSLVQLSIVPEDKALYLNSLLWDYAQDILVLYHRASSDYSGDDPIRKADGSIASNPQMTSGWKKAEKELNLSERRYSIDSFVIDFNPDFYSISICSLFCDAFNICRKYRTPKEILEVVSVEMPLSHWDSNTHQLLNPVLMPEEFGGKEGIFLNGYIDMVCKVLLDGQEVLALVDHKSSKSAFDSDGVAYNRQLLAYAYAYHQLTGTKIQAIGINNLRSNTLVLSPIDDSIMQSSLYNLFFSHNMIQSEVFIKTIPEDSYSKCTSSYGKPCPFLHVCYPHLYNKLLNTSSYSFSA